MSTENTLKRQLADVDLRKVFTEEKLAQCQQLFDEANEKFLQEALERTEEIDRIYQKASDEPEKASEHVRTICTLSHQLKGRMEALGFVFCYEIADSLYRYTRAANASTHTVLMVIAQHVHALQAALREHCESDGGDHGKEMMEMLSVLVAKLKPH